ncbi:AraC family transcriptional regulator [Sandaracinobacter sp. RS1-74]|uniref:helix-turn-helix transcriptional regulator n=1 Tax=Sandaracinobacteroides sayramensis TaxID=2913411 RepID=UPI001EDA8683|nr:AraC family transcriptional regulator [Sandaracinobacteroides sayramensis]MCG2840173.1 AraC family transcriptional regulator [Sandaracinobacteroides sayramensis]
MDGDPATSAENGRAALDKQALSHWLMHEAVAEARSYEMTVSPGLHVSAAIATMRTGSRGLGAFEFKGAGLSCMSLDGEHRFETTLLAGDTRTLGLYLPLADDPDCAPETAHILKALGSGTQVRATYKAPAALICRLCSPLDPWFSGTARAIAMEARQLELKATILAWLQGGHESRAHRHHGHARKAHDIIHDDPGAPVTIAFLAREVGLNARSLTEAFRAVYGVSIATCLANARLELALEMLATGASASQVAHRIGYAPAYFSMAFRRRYGLSPSAVRPAPDS